MPPVITSRHWVIVLSASNDGGTHVGIERGEHAASYWNVTPSSLGRVMRLF